MEKNGQPLEPPDLRNFYENQQRIPKELLFAHAGQHVAWSPDGTRILASGKTEEEVYENSKPPAFISARSCMATSTTPTWESSK